MNSKHMMTMACAAALCGSVLAGDNPITAEVSLAFDSKFLSYGLVDNNHPILTPSAAINFFDWATLGVESIFDITSYGRKAGYGNRAWRYQELDPGAAIGHAFGPDDCSLLPTTIEFELGYTYEYHPKAVDDDTHFLTFAIGLPDLWLEPAIGYELDLDRDHGTYVNLELWHTFALIAGAEEEADDVLDLRLSVSQGWGDRKRIGAYLEELDHSGMMDTCFKGELTWRINETVTLSGYVAYSDFLLDSTTRKAARDYEATGDWTESWNIISGLALSVAF